MTNLFVGSIKKVAEQKLTENGAVAYDRPSDSALLTLFGVIGALRSRDEKDIEGMFAAAYAEDPLLATKMLFHTGDVRGGLGERRTFKICLRWLAFNYPDTVRKNMLHIPFFNRFDTWYALVDTPVEKDMWLAMRGVYSGDMLNMMSNQPISLLGKWMKSINTSSAESRRLAKLTMDNLGFQNEKIYRKTLSRLRQVIRVVEKDMSQNRWDQIDYAGVPSYAMKNYASAFGRHNFEKFNAYIESLRKGETKINSSTLYPYDLVEPYLGWSDKEINDSIADEQWKALPDYLTKPDVNILCMADVSGSMMGRPMATSIGLSLYFAERTKGAFKNLYMTYTDVPHFISVDSNMTLRTKVKQAEKVGVGYNTNLELAFERVLELAVENRVPQEDLPRALIVISDSEIDGFRAGCTSYWGQKKNLDFVGTFKQKFAAHGYEMPKLVFFQVESRQNTFLTQDNGVLWVSGQSAAVFKSILNNIEGTPEELMSNTLNDERYNIITV